MPVIRESNFVVLVNMLMNCLDSPAVFHKVKLASDLMRYTAMTVEYDFLVPPRKVYLNKTMKYVCFSILYALKN